MTQTLGPDDPCGNCGIALKYHLVDDEDGGHYDCDYAINNVNQPPPEEQ
jgi:hypothetical protein